MQLNPFTNQLEGKVETDTPWSIGRCTRKDHFSNLLIMNSCPCISNTPHLKGQSNLKF